MFHFQAKKLLTALLDDELSLKKREQLWNHIDSCSKCQKELAELKKLNSILDTLPKQEPRTGLYWQTQQNNILHKTQKSVSESEIKPLPKPTRQIGWWKFTLAGSTIMVACFVVWFNVYHSQPKKHVNPEQQSLGGGIESYYIDNNVYPHTKQPETARSKKDTNSPQSEVQKKTLSKSIPEQNKSEIPALVPAPAAMPQSSISRRLPTANRGSEQESMDKLKVLNLPGGTIMPSAPPMAHTTKRESASALKEKNSLGINSTIKSDSLTWGGSIQGEGHWEFKDREFTAGTGGALASPSADSAKSPNQSATSKSVVNSLDDSNRNIKQEKLPESKPLLGNDKISQKLAFELTPFDSDTSDFQNLNKLALSEHAASNMDRFAQTTTVPQHSQAMFSSTLRPADNELLNSLYESLKIGNQLITINLNNVLLSQVLESIASTANIKILVISPHPDKLVSANFQSISLETVLNKIGRENGLPYITPDGNTYILTPYTFASYTDVTGYASITNKILLFQPKSKERYLRNLSTNRYLCPFCKKIELQPNWTYCPIDGSKIDKSIFKK